jgi:hypothetical protein
MTHHLTRTDVWEVMSGGIFLLLMTIDMLNCCSRRCYSRPERINIVVVDLSHRLLPDTRYMEIMSYSQSALCPESFDPTRNPYP